MESTSQLLYLNGLLMTKGPFELQEVGSKLMEENRCVPNNQDFSDLKIIGKGGFATVFSAKTVIFKNYKVVALKRLRKDESPVRLLEELEFNLKFKSDHLVKCLGAFVDFHPTLITELADGTLCDFLPNEEEAGFLFIDALNGLNYLHLNGLLHCDVKGDNLLIFKNTLKVSDFGAVTAFNKNVGSVRLPFPKGAFAYQPIQVLDNLQVAPWTDMYSLSQAFFEAMSGTPLTYPKSKKLNYEIRANKNALLYYRAIHNPFNGGRIVEKHGDPIFKPGCSKRSIKNVILDPNIVVRQPLADRLKVIGNMDWRMLLSSLLRLTSLRISTIEELKENVIFKRIQPCCQRPEPRIFERAAVIDTSPLTDFPLKTASTIYLGLKYFHFDKSEMTTEAVRLNKNRRILVLSNSVLMINPTPIAAGVNDTGSVIGFNHFTKRTRVVDNHELSCSSAVANPEALLQKNKNKPNDDDKLICKFCGQKLSHASSLSRHIKDQHTIKTKIECKFCGECFKRKENLDVHINQIRCPILKLNVKKVESDISKELTTVSSRNSDSSSSHSDFVDVPD